MSVVGYLIWRCILSYSVHAVMSLVSHEGITIRYLCFTTKQRFADTHELKYDESCHNIEQRVFFSNDSLSSEINHLRSIASWMSRDWSTAWNNMPGCPHARDLIWQTIANTQFSKTQRIDKKPFKFSKKDAQKPNARPAAIHHWGTSVWCGGRLPTRHREPRSLTRGNTARSIPEWRRTIIDQAISNLIAIFQRGFDNAPIYPNMWHLFT